MKMFRVAVYGLLGGFRSLRKCGSAEEKTRKNENECATRHVNCLLKTTSAEEVPWYDSARAVRRASVRAGALRRRAGANSKSLDPSNGVGVCAGEAIVRRR